MCIKASTLSQLEQRKRKYVFKLPAAAKNYILSVCDELLLPIARIAEGGILYGISTNGISEAMNSANQPARIRGLDMFNDYLRLTTLEQTRSHRNMSERSHVLTEYARVKYQELRVDASICEIVDSDGTTAAVYGKDMNLTCRLVLPTSRQRIPGSYVIECSFGVTEIDFFP